MYSIHNMPIALNVYIPIRDRRRASTYRNVMEKMDGKCNVLSGWFCMLLYLLLLSSSYTQSERSMMLGFVSYIYFYIILSLRDRVIVECQSRQREMRPLRHSIAIQYQQEYVSKNIDIGKNS
jgi:hypothetical protein